MHGDALLNDWNRKSLVRAEEYLGLQKACPAGNQQAAQATRRQPGTISRLRYVAAAECAGASIAGARRSKWAHSLVEYVEDPKSTKRREPRVCTTHTAAKRIGHYILCGHHHHSVTTVADVHSAQRLTSDCLATFFFGASPSLS
jgi:hypothetical protein